MKLKIKGLLLQACIMAGSIMSITSCNDFLDREPLSSVTPGVYFRTVDDFAAYSISKYLNIFPYHSGWGAGLANMDGGTDNMVAGDRNNRYVKGLWKVSSYGNWDFSLIRYCNYFFENAVPKYEAGQVTGIQADIRHYIGEMHFMRALAYYVQLKTYGDYPIITEVLPEDKNILMEKGVRQPRNKVARFILEELQKAADMMKGQGYENNTRLNREAALLMKSRVALYEASFERYHKGTGRVPGDSNWPGKKANPGYSLDIEAEVSFFLDEAMKASEEVAEKVKLTPNTQEVNPTAPTITSGWNPYLEMFATVDLSKTSEVLFWRQYASTTSYAIVHGAPAWTASGSNNGLLKSYIESFLMKDGRPWYAASTTAPYMGDVTLSNVKANRDNRLQLFMFGETDMLPYFSTEKTDKVKYFYPHPITQRGEMKDMTGYRIRKYISFDAKQNVYGGAESTTGSIIYRGVEAYLNYLEAYYMKNGRVAGKADTYWRAIRTRAGVDPDYAKTISATNMNQETDWGKYSGNQPVDATLLNIRRERRCEFIGEGMRWDDLIRWRSMDHLMVKNYIPEGCNFWEEIYKISKKNENGDAIEFVDTGDKPNISSREFKYLRPYSILKANNDVYNGYSWMKAYYLSPVPVREMELVSPDESVNNSVLYQNPYWPSVSGEGALE